MILAMAKPALDLSTLTSAEKLDLLDEIWASLEPSDFTPDSAQRAELDRRLDQLDRDGPVGTLWDVVRTKMSRSGP
jgi:putative addiction module component (TIGR02574 family)